MEHAVSRQSASTRITTDPRIVGGEPVVAGTRVPVRSIVLLHREYGDRARVLRAFPRITAADLDAALDYYTQHPDEIERYIAENES